MSIILSLAIAFLLFGFFTKSDNSDFNDLEFDRFWLGSDTEFKD